MHLEATVYYQLHLVNLAMLSCQVLFLAWISRKMAILLGLKCDSLFQDQEINIPI